MGTLQLWAFLTTLRCALGLWLLYHGCQLPFVFLKQAGLQAELGDVVYVELPEVGASVTKGEPFGVVESVKVSLPHKHRSWYAPACLTAPASLCRLPATCTPLLAAR